MHCKKPIRLQPKFPLKGARNPGRFLFVPCRKCLYCRLQRRKEWSERMLSEQTQHEDSAFVTLTYDEESVPKTNNEFQSFLKYTSEDIHDDEIRLLTLHKPDLQKYFKRLRRAGLKFKYFACGEYGDETLRPHYHSIVFGVPITEKLLSDKWDYGRVHVGAVEPDSIRYVAQYVDKKISVYGDDALYMGRDHEFQVCSNGIGAAYAKENAEKLARDLTDKRRNKPIGLPRYYVKKIAEALEPAAAEQFHKDLKHKGYLAELDRINELTGGKDLDIDEISPGEYSDLLYEQGKHYNAWLIRRAEHFRDMSLVRKSKGRI